MLQIIINEDCFPGWTFCPLNHTLMSCKGINYGLRHILYACGKVEYLFLLSQNVNLSLIYGNLYRGMFHLQFQQLLPWAAAAVCVCQPCGDFAGQLSPHWRDEQAAQQESQDCPVIRLAPISHAPTSTQVERWTGSVFVTRGYAVTALRDAALHKDWFTGLMGTCVQHMVKLEQSGSHGPMETWLQESFTQHSHTATQIHVLVQTPVLQGGWSVVI